MKVHVVGSSGTFPTPTNPGSGYVIENRETRVWCDAGPNTFTALPVDSDLIDAIVISHRHPDHCSDFFTAYHAWAFRPEPRSGVPVYANDDVLSHLTAFVSGSGHRAFEETFDLRPVGEGDRVVEGDLEISFHEMDHSVPALGTSWVGDGRTLFFTGDTGPGDWTRQLDGVDVLLSESAIPGEREKGDAMKHLSPYEAGQIAREAGVGSLVLTHIPPYVDVSESVAAAESTFGRPVRPAVAGTRFKV